jgi:hypothetical protein
MNRDPNAKPCDGALLTGHRCEKDSAYVTYATNVGGNVIAVNVCSDCYHEAVYIGRATIYT